MTQAGAHLVIVAPAELAAGFRLAGMEVRLAENPHEAAVIVANLQAEGEQGVIAVYEPHIAGFDPSLRDRIEQSVSPVVVGIPSGLDAEGEEGRRARLVGLLQRAVGYHITFEEDAS